MEVLNHRIDFLTVRLTEKTKLWHQLISRVDNAPEYPCMAVPGWRFVLDGIRANGCSKWLWLLDCNGNKVATVQLRLGALYDSLDPDGSERRQNRNFPSCIQFNGTFCTYYFSQLARLLDYFDIPDEPRRIIRLDYRFDIHGMKVSKIHSLLAVPDSDKPDRMVETRGVETWFQRKSDRTEIVSYDKKLDIVQNGLDLVVPDFYSDGSFHLRDYLDMPKSVSRLEIRLTSRYFKDNPQLGTFTDCLVNARELVLKHLRDRRYMGDRVPCELFNLKDDIDVLDYARSIFSDIDFDDVSWRQSRNVRLAYQKRNFEAYLRNITETVGLEAGIEYFDQVRTRILFGKNGGVL